MNQIFLKLKLILIYDNRFTKVDIMLDLNRQVNFCVSKRTYNSQITNQVSNHIKNEIRLDISVPVMRRINQVFNKVFIQIYEKTSGIQID